MQSMNHSRFPRRLLPAACLLAALLVTSLAAAYGSVKWKSTRLKERESRGGSWHIELTITLNRAPDMPTVPVKFEFKENTYYERYKDDAHGDKPVIRRVPTPGKQPIVESSDIGFLDPSDGKIQKRTRFSFKITRGHGFEAGDWTVTIRDARNGQILGHATRLILEGENPVVDRRSMVFAGTVKKKEEKKEEAEEESSEPNPEEDEANWPETTDEELYGPTHEGEVEEKPGGCGCRAAGGSGPVLPLALGLAALAIGVAGRRRRQRRI
jgi:MYXO-CTERM domain-containing protein